MFVFKGKIRLIKLKLQIFFTLTWSLSEVRKKRKKEKGHMKFEPRPLADIRQIGTNNNIKLTIVFPGTCPNSHRGQAVPIEHL